MADKNYAKTIKMRTFHWIAAVVIAIVIVALFVAIVSVLFRIVMFAVLIGMVYIIIRVWYNRNN